MNQNFASTFAPYTPPPDDPSRQHQQPPSTSSSRTRPWFPSQESSYQAGGLPSLGNSYGNNEEPTSTSLGHQQELDNSAHQWETRYGWPVTYEAPCAYLLGPLSALILLVIETHNDYVRFHAYQSALLSTPLLLIRLFFGLFHFPSFLLFFSTTVLVVACCSMAVVAYLFAQPSRGLERYHLFMIGSSAERWVEEEHQLS